MTATVYSANPLRSRKKSWSHLSEFPMEEKGVDYIQKFHKLPKEAQLIVSYVHGPGYSWKYTWTWYETEV